MEKIILDIPNGYEFFGINDDNKVVLTKKQPQYPKTYIECAKILNCFSASYIDGYRNELLEKFQQLLIYRDAYWKIAGKEMGLNKPWKPDWNSDENKFCIETYREKIVYDDSQYINRVLAFPTAEMRDAFYENFRELIKQCKELLG